MTLSSPLHCDRDTWIDWGKAIASQLIIWHHLVIYGPMSRDASASVSWLWEWLAGEARLAVQIFLVMGGYLSAKVLSVPWGPPPTPLRHSAGRVWVQWVVRRYQRLMALGVLAVLTAVLAAAWARDILPDPDTPAAPSWEQLAANMLLLHDVLALDAVSAGLWYVAIDWQLFACLAALACWQRSGAAWRASAGALWVVAAGLFGLFWANLQPGWDVVAPYFFGSYALGIVAFWLRHAQPETRRAGAGLLACVVVVALMWAWRDRLLLAGVTAWVLIFQPGASRLVRSQCHPVIQWLADISYPVFLFHYSVCMVCGAWVGRLWPGDELANTLGLVGTWLVCLAVGGGMAYVQNHGPKPSLNGRRAQMTGPARAESA